MTTTLETTEHVLVTAATGKSGRRVAARLARAGERVRLGTRSPSDGAPRFDWDDETTWRPALEGVRSAYLAYVPDICVPGAVETIDRFTTLATQLGVHRLVLLSGRGEPEARRAERAVLAAAQAGGAEATVVRCAWFAQNFSESFLLDGVREGALVLPVSDVPEPFVDAEDIADVAFAALTEPGHAGEVYELTGPRALSFGEAASIIGGATGRSIDFVSVPMGDYIAQLRGFGVPEDAIALYAYLLGEVLDGRNTAVGDGVERALGRPARPFEDYARRTAETGVWHAAEAGVA